MISQNGFRYYVLFVDDFTRFTWIYFLHSKDEVSHVFSLFKSQVENLLNSTIKILRTDGGTEFKPITCMFPSILHQTSCPYTPEQNGLAERKHRHVVELSLAITSQASLPASLWDDIFLSVVYLINRLPSSSNVEPPYTLLLKKSPNYALLRVLGCACFSYTRPYTNHKLQNRALPCVFIGYASSQKGYKCLHVESNRVYVSRHVIFDEDHFPFRDNTSGSPASSESSVLAPAHWFPLAINSPAAISLSDMPSAQMPANFGPASSTPSQAATSSQPTSSQQAEQPTSQPILHSAQHTSPLLSSQQAEPAHLASSSQENSHMSPAQAQAVSPPPNRPVLFSTPLDASLDPQPNFTAPIHPMVTRTRDNTRRVKQFLDHIALLATSTLSQEPKTYSQASKDPNWNSAMST